MPRLFVVDHDKDFQVRWIDASPNSEPLVSIHFRNAAGESEKLLLSPEVANTLADLLRYAAEESS